MTDDVLANLGAQRKTDEKRRHRHRWQTNIYSPQWRGAHIGCSCGTLKDEAKSRKGRSARSRGNRRELYVERKYGPKKKGQFQDAIDNVGSTFKWQSKSRQVHAPSCRCRSWPKCQTPQWVMDLHDIKGVKAAKWFTAPMEHMAGLRDDLHPLVIRSFTRQGWSKDVIVVRADDWAVWHDGFPEPGQWDYYAMSGDYFLDIHGRDES